MSDFTEMVFWQKQTDRAEVKVERLRKALESIRDIPVPEGGSMGMRNAARHILRQTYTIAYKALIDNKQN